MARMRKYNRGLLNQTPTYVSICIQFMIRSHDRKHDYFLTLLILNSEVLKGTEKQKSKAYRLLLNGQMPSSSLNRKKFAFSCGDITEAFIFQSISRALLVLQECKSKK